MSSLLLLGLIATPNAAATGLWTELPLDQALARARRQGAPVMLDVYADWCGPCQALDKDVFPDAAVIEEARSFMAIKLDGETPEGERIRKRYHVVGYPTVLFLEPSGAEIDRIFGYKPPEEFVQAMRDYRAGRNTVSALRNELKRRPTDLELTFALGRRLAIRGEAAAAEKLLNRVRRADADNARGLASKAMLTLGKYLYLRGGGRHEEALATLDALRKDHPDSPEARRALYPIARALHGLGDPEGALARLQSAIDAAPDEIGGYNTFAWFSFKQDVDRSRGIAVAKAGLARKPDAAGLWDTLAELYHATGQRDLAVEAIDKAMAIDPEDEYFRKQRAKFAGSAADPG